MQRQMILLVVAGIAAFSASMASGAPGSRDVYTDGAKATKFDVYTDGAKATRFDVYTDGAKTPSPRHIPDVAVSRPKDCDPYCGGERQVG